jgi:hypothetical protein
VSAHSPNQSETSGDMGQSGALEPSATFMDGIMDQLTVYVS